MLFVTKTNKLSDPYQFLTDDQVAQQLAPALQPYLTMNSVKTCLLKKEASCFAGNGGTGTTVATNTQTCVGFGKIKDIGGTGVTIDYTDPSAATNNSVEKGKITLPAGYMYVLELRLMSILPNRNPYGTGTTSALISTQLCLFNSAGPNYWDFETDANPAIASYFIKHGTAITPTQSGPVYHTNTTNFTDCVGIVDATAGSVDVGFVVRTWGTQWGSGTPRLVILGDTTLNEELSFTTGTNTGSTQCLITQISV